MNDRNFLLTFQPKHANIENEDISSNDEAEERRDDLLTLQHSIIGKSEALADLEFLSMWNL